MSKTAKNKQKEIEAEESDPFAQSARVSEETSSDGKHSTYERANDLILQYRGEPK